MFFRERRRPRRQFMPDADEGVGAPMTVLPMSEFYLIPEQSDNFVNEYFAVAQRFGTRQKGQQVDPIARGKGGRRLDNLESGAAEYIGGTRHVPGVSDEIDFFDAGLLQGLE